MKLNRSRNPVLFTCLRVLILFAGLLFPLAVNAQHWSRFRGENGAGVSDATSIPTSWNNNDYNWQMQLPGVGHSSPVIWGQLLVTSYAAEDTGQRFVIGVDTLTGVERWRQRYGESVHRKHKLNSFASASPAVDELHVYVCWGTPEQFYVLALDHSGKEIWRRNLGPYKAGHGDGVSPIVHRETVVIAKEHEGPSELFGIDRMSGETRWRVARESKSTWSTPCVRKVDTDRAELIFVNWENGITALNPDNGDLLWEMDVFDKGHFESSIASPIVAGDLVLGSSGYLSVRQEVIAVRAPDNADKQPTKVYCIDRGVPLCTTPLVVGELLFLWADNGIVTCADLRSGKTHWRKRVGGTFYASPICVGGRVFNVSTAGEVVVVSAKPEFQLLARNSLGETSHATPAVASGRMFLRTASQLFSLGGE